MVGPGDALVSGLAVEFEIGPGGVAPLDSVAPEGGGADAGSLLAPPGGGARPIAWIAIS